MHRYIVHVQNAEMLLAVHCNSSGQQGLSCFLENGQKHSCIHIGVLEATQVDDSSLVKEQHNNQLLAIVGTVWLLWPVVCGC